MPEGVDPTAQNATALFSARARPSASPQPASGPSIKVNFDQGLPDPSLFPIDQLKRCFIETLDVDGVDACSYFGEGGALEMQYGYEGLREALAQRMAARDGQSVGADGVVLVHGSTDGLALAINAFLGPGDGALVEEATYYHT